MTDTAALREQLERLNAFGMSVHCTIEDNDIIQRVVRGTAALIDEIERLREVIADCVEAIKEGRDHLTPRDAHGDVGDSMVRVEMAARAFLDTRAAEAG